MKMNQRDCIVQRLNTGEWFSNGDVFGNPVHQHPRSFCEWNAPPGKDAGAGVIFAAG
jgi:hypothetical protein